MAHIDYHVNNLSKDVKKTMLSRVLVSLMILLTVLPLVIVGDYGIFCIVLFIVGVSGHEILHVVKTKYQLDASIYIVTYFALFLPFIITPLLNNLYGNYPLYDLVHGFTSFNFLFISVVIILICNLALTILNKKFNLDLAFYLICLELLIVFGCLSVLYLRYLPLLNTLDSNNINIYDGSISLVDRFFTSIILLLYIAAGAIFNDIFAYFTGVLFGKHKMCPKISPKKTWEGFIGGVVFSCLLTFGIAMLLTYYNCPLFNKISLDKWYLILIISLVIPFVGTLGDLFFSSVKRHFDIKDFGVLLKSHGGVLDRMDSILFACIVGTLIVALINIF